MNKYFMFGIVSLFFIFVGSFAYGLEEVVDFQDKIHFVLNTPTTEYKNPYYAINKELPITFNMKVLGPPSPRTFIVGYVDSEDTFYPCYNETMFTINETYYARCTLEFNETGIYFISLKLDSVVYELEAVEIKDAIPSSLCIALLLIGGILIYLGLRYAKELFVLGLFIFNGGVLDLIFTYQYLINFIFIGVISLYFLVLVYIVFLTMKE